ncbi:MAG TPA: thioredoxin domain-containing protein [Pyrinomonadaceae bacterium]|jgi:protein-disulfide isomerase
MKFFIAIFYIAVCSLALFAQTNTEILAAANGQKFTVADLPPDLREAYKQRNAKTARLRQEILTQMIVDTLLETEAAARRIEVEKLLEEIKPELIRTPTEAEIKAVYTANKAKIGERALDDGLRAQIVAFLSREAEQKATVAFVKRLQVKYKVTPVKPLNAPNLKAADVLFTVGAKRITVAQFEQRARREIYEFRAGVYDAVVYALEETIYSRLVETEAQKSGIASGDLLAREITDKLRDFSDEESARLRDDFQQRLFQKYNAQILVKEPEPFAQNISTDDDPFQGNANAPVTIVMFSDFQCSACSATHPVLQKVLAGYGDKIRFVVRDFPLTTIHKDAFLAAQAANAANAQGKFFEYTEILYRNQAALDAASLKKYAADSGLNVGQFELDLQSGKFATEVRRDMADGKSYGINGTPTIFVNGVKVRGLSAKSFRAAIEKALAKTKAGSGSK